MPLDANMPDAGSLVRAADVRVRDSSQGGTRVEVVADDGTVRVTTVEATHGRAVPALAYRFDTADGSVMFSGDTTASDSLASLARDADILVHEVADLGFLARHDRRRPGTDGSAAHRCHPGRRRRRTLRVRELILSDYLPADPEAITENEWAQRAWRGFSGITTAGRDGLPRTLGHPPAGDSGHTP
jgi:ribonuclease BN (tRNA processing enzyme)